MKLKIEVLNKQRKIKVSLIKLKAMVKKIFKLLLKFKDKNLLKTFKDADASVKISIVFLSSRKMQEVNFKYRGKKSTTDVLSFFYLTKEDSDTIFLGEILIEPKRVLSQSKMYSVTFWQELTRVLIHGILHLINYDHEKSKYQAQKMKAIENKILKALSEQT